MKYIIDTNVPLKAADMHPNSELDAKCSLECLNFIKEIINSQDVIVVLDSNGEILREYSNNLNTCGQNTVSTLFFNWICKNLTLRQNGRIEMQYITVIGDREYVEFPQTSSLDGFDISDRKFIALANAHMEHPKIVEGTDSLWWGFKDVLKDLGIHIYFLCEDYVRTKYEEGHHG